MARITGLTQSTTQRALTRLREGGLVLTEPAPPSLLYRANPDHLAMPAMVSLLGLDDELRARVAERVAVWRLPPASLIVYGSVARKEATSASDLDVLVVRPDATEPDDATWQGQVADLGDCLRRWTGRRASLIDMNQHELVQGLADREPFLAAADRDGWLIAGRPLRDLLGRKS